MSGEQIRVRQKKAYGCILLLFLFLLAFFIFTPLFFTPVEGGELLSEKENILNFADYLFETKEYYRAITEYTRFLFFFPDDPLVKVVRLKIAHAYQKGEQWPDALRLFDAIRRDYAGREIGKEAFLQSAETLRLQKSYQEAIQRYHLFIKKYPEDERVNACFFRIGCIQLELQEWLKAAESFNRVKSNSRYFIESKYLGQEAKKLPFLPMKNPALAGLLSSVIPGSGQMYAHRFRDGLTAFLVNGGFIWGISEAFHQDQNSLGSILLFIELGWYAGNIYSAVTSTKKYNQQKIEKKLIPLLERCRLSFINHPRKKLSRITFNFLLN